MLRVDMDETSQLSLQGYATDSSVDICWDNDASIFAVYVYDDGVNINSTAYASNSLNSTHTDNGFSNAVSNHGHESCFTVTTSNTPLSIRLKAFYETTDVYAVPAPGQIIPRQGILIESIGVAGEAAKTVRAVKSDASLPTVFDYVLFQKSLTDPLSN
jgi:hypothetical protein